MQTKEKRATSHEPRPSKKRDKRQETINILGIETSCDETAAAVVTNGKIIKSSIVASQNKLHEKYGGVVPEIASRAHIEKIYPVITEALEQAKVNQETIDAIAVANQPGLTIALMVSSAVGDSKRRKHRAARHRTNRIGRPYNSLRL